MNKLARRLVLALVLLTVAYAGFRWGPDVVPRLQAFLGSGAAVEIGGEASPSPEVAEATLDRFEAFRAGEAGERLELGSVELTSVVRHSLPGLLPSGISEPDVRLEDGRIHVSSRVAVAAFPRLPDLERVVGFLPDTVLVDMRGSLAPLDQGHLALAVDRVRVARIPLPSRMVGDVLAGLRGDRETAGLPEDALPVPLPDGIESVFIEGDRLVLVSDRTGGN